MVGPRPAATAAPRFEPGPPGPGLLRRRQVLISARLALGAAASSSRPRSGHWRPHRSLGQRAPCESTGRSPASMRLPRSRQKRARVVAALRPSPAGSGPEANGPMAEPGDRGTAAVDEFRRRTGPFGYRSVRCRNRSRRCADKNWKSAPAKAPRKLPFRRKLV